MSLIDPNTTLAQLVLDHPECARVLREHRLDFCCRGDVSLAAACESSGLELAAVVAPLEVAITEQTERRAGIDARALSTEALIAHVVERHHGYLRRSLPYAEQLARKVSRVHGEHNPKLVPLAEAVIELRSSLEPHLDEEEESLFPLMTQAGPPAERIRAKLDAMYAEHLAVGALLERIRADADDFVPPDWACGSYRTLMSMLEEIERDTFEHVHLENHILAPRAAPPVEPPAHSHRVGAGV